MDINSIGGAATLSPPSSATMRPAGQPPPGAASVVNKAPTDSPETLAPSGIAVKTPDAVFARRYTARPENDARQGKPSLEQQEASLRERVEESVEDLNEFVQPYNTSLQFAIEEENQTVIVKVIDRDTHEVLKQLPSEEAIELAKALDKLKGLLIQQKA